MIHDHLHLFFEERRGEYHEVLAFCDVLWDGLDGIFSELL